PRRKERRLQCWQPAGCFVEKYDGNAWQKCVQGNADRRREGQCLHSENFSIKRKIIKTDF
ncbi:MAG: hypothetical protein RR100_24930, partial [Comamonas sp.]